MFERQFAQRSVRQNKKHCKLDKGFLMTVDRRRSMELTRCILWVQT